MTTIHFHNVYVASRGTSVGLLEKQGPLGNRFDYTHEDNTCQQDSFEKAERYMLQEAVDAAIRKSDYSIKDIEVMIGGDLINQLTSSHYFAKEFPISFLGMYAACASSSLVIGQAALWVEHQLAKTALAFTSSHVATAERQFRFPNEYGIQKKETTTCTVTGAGAVLLSRKKSKLKVASFTVGKVVDWQYNDANDMGVAMAPAAYDTLTTYFKDTNQSFQDFDLIVTGDLSKLGFAFLRDLLLQNGYCCEEKLQDCGLMIYDIVKQNVFCGGSGCACSMCVSMTKLLDLLEQQEARRIMVLATGALMSPIAIQQKESIPCIAHAIVYERS